MIYNAVSKIKTIIVLVIVILAFFIFMGQSNEVVFANSYAWNGSVDISWYDDEDIYEISTAEQLAGFAELVNDGEDFEGITVVLTADIELNANYVFGFNTETGLVEVESSQIESISLNKFTPIGKSRGDSFEGIFDGCGHKISGIYITTEDKNYCGLFGYSKGDIFNVSIENSFINGDNYVGAIVGKNDGGNIENCSNSGIVAGSASVGGIVGDNEDGNVIYCGDTGDVYAKGSNVGGVVGNNTGKIENSYNCGSITSRDSYIGGLVGKNVGGSYYNGGKYGSIYNCYNSGAVCGDSNIGGLIGYNEGNAKYSNLYILDKINPSSISCLNFNKNGAFNSFTIVNGSVCSSITDALNSYEGNEDSDIVWEEADGGGIGFVYAKPVSVVKELELETSPTATPIYIGERLSDSVLGGGQCVVKGTDKVVDGVFSWVDSDVVPTINQSGQSFDVVFVPKNNDYSSLIIQVKVSVNKYDKLPPSSIGGIYCVSAKDSSKFQYTISAVVGAEYSMDGKAWQKGNSFDLLTPNVEYTFYIRYYESATHNASEYICEKLTLDKFNNDKVAFEKDSLSILYGQDVVNGLNSYNGDVSYSSSNNDIATVDNAGNLEVKGVGSVVITATIFETEIYAQTEVSYSLNIAKGQPRYKLVDRILAKEGQTLGEINEKIGENFTFDVGSEELVGDIGYNDFKVTYTPDDTDNYNLVSGLTVTILVLGEDKTDDEIEEYEKTTDNLNNKVEEIENSVGEELANKLKQDVYNTCATGDTQQLDEFNQIVSSAKSGSISDEDIVEGDDGGYRKQVSFENKNKLLISTNDKDVQYFVSNGVLSNVLKLVDDNLSSDSLRDVDNNEINLKNYKTTNCNYTIKVTSDDSTITIAYDGVEGKTYYIAHAVNVDGAYTIEYIPVVCSNGLFTFSPTSYSPFMLLEENVNISGGISGGSSSGGSPKPPIDKISPTITVDNNIVVIEDENLESVTIGECGIKVSGSVVNINLFDFKDGNYNIVAKDSFGNETLKSVVVENIIDVPAKDIDENNETNIDDVYSNSENYLLYIAIASIIVVGAITAIKIKKKRHN